VQSFCCEQRPCFKEVQSACQSLVSSSGGLPVVISWWSCLGDDTFNHGHPIVVFVPSTIMSMSCITHTCATLWSIGHGFGLEVPKDHSWSVMVWVVQLVKRHGKSATSYQYNSSNEKAVPRLPTGEVDMCPWPGEVTVQRRDKNG